MYEIVADTEYGREVVEDEIETRADAKYLLGEYQLAYNSFGSVFMRYQRPKRYYLAAGGGGTYTPNPEIKQILKDHGAKNIRTAKQFGWSNQPEVFTFDLRCDSAMRPVENALYENCGDLLPLIHEHWSN